MLLVTLRWVGTVALLLIVAHRNIWEDWAALKGNWIFLLVMGMLGLTAFNALFYAAAYTTSALNIGIIQGSIPVFVLIGAFGMYRSRVGGLQILGIAITLIGVLIVTSNGSLDRLLGLSFQRGDVLMVIACILYAGYSVGLQRCPKASHLSLFTMFAFGALLASFPLVAVETAMGNLIWPSTKGWVIIGLITLFPSFIAHLVYIKGVSIIGASRAGIFFNLVPIFAALIAVLFLGERFVLYHAVALALVLGGIAISESRKKTIA